MKFTLSMLLKYLKILLLILCPFLSNAQQNTGKGTICRDTIFDRYLTAKYLGNSILQFNSKGECNSFVNNIVMPSGMVISGSVVYVAENKNHIKGFRLNDGALVFETVLGNQANLNGLTTDNDSLLYTIDTDGGILYKVNFLDSTYKSIGEINNIADFKYDGRNKRIVFCTNKENQKVLTYNIASQLFDTLFFLPTKVNECESLEIDSCGNIFVSTYDHVFYFNKKDDYLIHDLLQCINDNVYMMVDQSDSKVIIAANNWTKLLKYDISEFYSKQQIQNQFDLFMEYFKENKMLSIASIYDDDAYILEPGKTVHGRKEIDEYWLALENIGESWVLENKILDASIDVIKYQTFYQKMRYKPRDWSSLGISTTGVYYMLGVSKLKTINGPLSVTDFVLVWKKDSTGKWKILVDSYVVEDMISGLNKSSNNSNLHCYPNPTSKEINIKFNIEQQTIVRIDIFNSKGQIVNSLINKKLPQGEYVINIPVENLRNGIYSCYLHKEIISEKFEFLILK